MFCKKCGEQLPENARFCPQCGTEVSATAQPVEETPSSQTAQSAGFDPPPPPQQASQSTPSQGIVCPKCGSSDLKIERFTWWGGMLGAALANRLSCRSCGHKFKINR